MNEQLEKDIRAEMEEVKELKRSVGEINSHLNIIESLCAFDNEALEQREKEAYRKGLDDAWEAARKIVCDEKLDWNTLLHLFNKCNFTGIFGEFSASEAIEKLKAYEEKQKADDEIKVGDEVISLKANGEVIEDMSPWIVTYETKYSYQGFEASGMFHKNPKDCVRKTGRHFDIEAILKEMANENN